MKIYSDMDGVLADFFGALAQEYFVDHWKEIEDIDEVLDELSGTSFFRRLSTFHKVTYPLIGHLKEIESTNKFIQWGIISTPLKCDHDHSIKMKRLWLAEKNILPAPMLLIFTQPLQVKVLLLLALDGVLFKYLLAVGSNLNDCVATPL